jgi:hypothetical protein
MVVMVARTMAAALVAVTLGAAACGPGKGVDPSQYANLPPQDTLAGGLAPAPSTATGGAVATPAHPSQPAGEATVAAAGATPPPAAAGNELTGTDAAGVGR